MTDVQKTRIEFCKNYLTSEIAKTISISEKLKDTLEPEIIMSIIYLEFFSASLEGKKFDTVEESWKFMNDIKGIVDKIFYVNNFLERKIEYIKSNYKK